MTQDASRSSFTADGALDEAMCSAQQQIARWERLFDAIADPIGVVSADNILVYANAAYRALFGRAPDGVHGHECFSAHPNPSGGPCATCPVPAAIRSRQPAFVQSERPQQSAVGAANAAEAGAASDTTSTARRVFQRWTYPVIEPDGRIEDVVEIIKDVTEQERLREAAREAEAVRMADRLKAELLGTVSHELRSPLAAIKGYAGTLLRHEGRLPRAERREFLTAISEASDRLEAIIDQLLLMSQLETGLITPQRAPVDVRRLAREAKVDIEGSLPLERRGASARLRVVIDDRTLADAAAPSSAPPTLVVDGDHQLLRQALDEVLDNAVKYSPEGGQIGVTLRHVAPGVAPMDADGEATAAPETAATAAAPFGMVELCVSDEGPGIPAEQLPQVFDRFHRVDSRLTSEVGGMGLGLAICKRVIELHGGSVQVQSEPGKGSVFCLLLPRREPAPGQIDGIAADPLDPLDLLDPTRPTDVPKREDG